MTVLETYLEEKKDTSIGNKTQYYTIGQVSEITGIKQNILRFWENEFQQLSPLKNKFGHRVYKEKDIIIVRKIQELLYQRGMTIKGAKQVLAGNEDFLENPPVIGKAMAKYIREELEEMLVLLRSFHL
jgi:DNA-binding transcriptional MerR regulator